MKVSVSILKEYDRLINAVKKVNESNADYLHIDVMDGKFVDNKKFPIEVVKDIKSICKKQMDIHLMVDNIDTVLDYSKLEPYFLTFHVEIIKDNSIIKLLKEKGIKVGLAINPETDIELLMPYVNDIDLVLFMSVKPGKGGQDFKTEVLDKIKSFKERVNNNIIISIDGGINNNTIDLVKEAGCDMVVSGSYITNSDNYDLMINNLK